MVAIRVGVAASVFACFGHPALRGDGLRDPRPAFAIRVEVVDGAYVQLLRAGDRGTLEGMLRDSLPGRFEELFGFARWRNLRRARDTLVVRWSQDPDKEFAALKVQLFLSGRQRDADTLVADAELWEKALQMMNNADQMQVPVVCRRWIEELTNVLIKRSGYVVANILGQVPMDAGIVFARDVLRASVRVGPDEIEAEAVQFRVRGRFADPSTDPEFDRNLDVDVMLNHCQPTEGRYVCDADTLALGRGPESVRRPPNGPEELARVHKDGRTLHVRSYLPRRGRSTGPENAPRREEP